MDFTYIDLVSHLFAIGVGALIAHIRGRRITNKVQPAQPAVIQSPPPPQEPQEPEEKRVEVDAADTKDTLPEIPRYAREINEILSRKGARFLDEYY